MVDSSKRTLATFAVIVMSSCIVVPMLFNSPVGQVGPHEVPNSQMAKPEAATTLAGNQAAIPKVIMQTGKDRSESNRESWLKLNPGWEYVFFDDALAMEFLSAVGQIHARNFDLIIPGTIKADYLRLVWLLSLGGVYVDIDNHPDVLDTYINDADIVLVKGMGERDCTSQIYNAFMAAPARSPLVEKMLNLAMHNIEIRRRPSWGAQSCYDVAGPTVVARALKEAVPKHCTQQQFKCSTLFDSDACNSPHGSLYKTEDGETVRILMEGEGDALSRKVYFGSPYGSKCKQGLLYHDVPGWTTAAPADPPLEGIPKIIMQTGKDMSEANGDDWLNVNPGWEYVFLDDAAAIKYLKSVDQIHASNFELIIPGAIKADYLRLVWLSRKGGVFIDIDNQPDALEGYVKDADIVLAKSLGEPQCASQIHNALMAAPPNSPLIAKMLNMSMHNIKIRKRPRWGEQSCYDVAGPTVVARTLKKAMPEHCSQRQFKCSTRFDSDACNFPHGGIHETAVGGRIKNIHKTEDGERVKMLLEGESRVLQRKFYSGSPYGSKCAQGLFYHDTPAWQD